MKTRASTVLRMAREYVEARTRCVRDPLADLDPAPAAAPRTPAKERELLLVELEVALAQCDHLVSSAHRIEPCTLARTLIHSAQAEIADILEQQAGAA